MTWEPESYGEGLRMAWDEDDDGVEHCAAHIEPYLPDSGIAVDIGCGVGRLTVPLARTHPNLLWFGVDTSPAMLAKAPCDTSVSWQCDLPPRFEFAFSVVTFQHMTDSEMRHYLAEVGRQEATFVFQFVEGSEREPLSMQRPIGWVREWCYAAGFTSLDMWRDNRFETWRWVHAR